ncbi:MAG TPA: 50S ribosomal protein L25 [Candidatus Krumholzibacteria bacterium]|nr:50S ribosomal protein L25 [Candidatus Krumholzibacteria bacterium]
MERFQLNSEFRGDGGKGVARKLRMAGRLPAVLYGRKENPVGLSVDEVDIKNILRKHPESAIVDLTIAGKEPAALNAIIRDVQRHPASGKLLHLDLQRISLDEKVRVEVPVHLLGTPAGVKDQGGILEHGTRTVNVLCLPTEIPDAINVDATALKIHDSSRISDIAAMFPNVEFLDDPDTTLATVIPPIVEVAAATAGAEGVAEPELIRKPGEAEGAEKTGEKKAGEKKD